MAVDPNVAAAITAQQDPGGGVAPGTGNNTGVDQQLGLRPQEASLPVSLVGPPGGIGPPDPSRTRTLRDALNSWYTMDPAQLEELQRQLYQGGFYGRAWYSKGQEPAYGDSSDSAGFSAYRSALRSAALGHRGLDQVVAGGGVNKDVAVTAGAGGAPRVPRLGVISTAGRYQTTLSNPDEVKLVVDQVFRTFLHHNASEAEHQQVIDALNQQDIATGQSKMAEGEAARQADFQARVADRDQQMAIYNSQTGGNVPVDTAQTQATIESVAQQLGVDPRLAVAIAKQESGMDPNQRGDNNSSFGVFQLHQGGELGTHSPDQVMGQAGVELNARIALSVVADVARQHPDWSPGQIAAAAQRPASPKSYATSVDAIYNHGPHASTDVGGSVVTAAQARMGQAYAYGGTNPATGEDCSAFTQDLYGQAGVQLGRTTAEQVNQGTLVGSSLADLAKAQPGDLIFFGDPSSGPNGHVGIYMGNGQMISETHAGRGVATDSVAGWAASGEALHSIRRVSSSGKAIQPITRTADQYLSPQMDTITQTASPQAQAETMLRQAHPVEAGMHDAGLDTFSGFLKVIKGVGG